MGEHGWSFKYGGFDWFIVGGGRCAIGKAEGLAITKSFVGGACGCGLGTDWSGFCAG